MKTKHMRRSVILLLGLLFVAILAIPMRAQGLHPYGPPTRPELMVMLYSGRENPTCELTDADLNRIRELIDKFPATSSEQAGESPRRGSYTGFMVGELPAAKPEDYVIAAVYRNRVEVRTFTSGKGSTVVYKADDKRTLELLLLKIADAQGLLDPKARAHIHSGEDSRNKKRE